MFGCTVLKTCELKLYNKKLGAKRWHHDRPQVKRWGDSGEKTEAREIGGEQVCTHSSEIGW